MSSSNLRRTLAACAAALFCLLCVPAGLAADISAVIVDQNGKPAKDAVISASPLSTDLPAVDTSSAIVDQINKEFVPHVRVVTVGTPINFPNKDDIRHHVYSFSDAKTFELPLYEGTPANPVVFDQAGVVVLGCNIHDWMRGYIYVVETAHFAQTGEDGRAEITGLLPGDYELVVWHPRMKDQQRLTRQITLQASPPEAFEFELDLKPAIRIRRAPKARRRGY